MNKINSLALINFQKWKDLTLEFHPGVNVICGTSDAGKSTIIRALRWALHPKVTAPVSYIKRGEKMAGAEISTDNGDIARITGSVNAYIVNGEEFKGFGTTLPENVINVMFLSDINFQKQHDPVFLLSKTDGEISKAINTYAGIEDMDRVMANLHGYIKEEKSGLNSTNSQIQDCENTLESFKWLEEAKAGLKGLNERFDKLEVKRQRLSRLKKSLTDIGILNQKLKSSTDVEEDLESIIGLISLSEGITQKRRDMMKINVFLVVADELINTTPVEHYDEVIKTINAIDVRVMELEVKKETLVRLKGMLNTANKRKISLNSYDDTIRGLEAEYHETLPIIECPECKHQFRKEL